MGALHNRRLLQILNSGFLRAGFAVATFGFVVWLAVDAFSKFQFESISTLPLVYSALLYAGVVAALPFFWLLLLRAYGTESDPDRKNRHLLSLLLVYSRSWIARYLPGRVWMFGGRVIYGSAIGVPRWTVFKTTLVEGILLQGLLAWLSGIVFLVFFGYAWAAAVLAAVGLISAVGYVRYQETLARNVPVERIRDLLIAVDGPVAAKLVLQGSIITVLQLLSVTVLAAAVLDVDSATAWQIAGLWGISVVAGYLTMVTPAGFGVREAVGVVLISSVVDRTDAVIFMAVVRAITLAVDLGYAALIEGLARVSGLRATAPVDPDDSERPPIRIAYVGAYDSDYPRNRIIIDGLRESGVRVTELNIRLKGTKSTAFQSRRVLNVISLLIQQARHQLVLAWTLARLRDTDAVIVGFPGYQDIPLAWIATRLRRIPLVFDPLVSAHETLIEDRQLYRADSIFARLLLAIEKVLFRLPDLVIADTDNHAGYFSSVFGARRVATSYVGSSTGFFDAAYTPPATGEQPGPFRVLFYGSYIPLHGIEHIVDAAAMLKDEEVVFEIIGSGQTFEVTLARVSKLGIQNIRLRGWADQPAIIESVASADLCLGIFGDTPKANRVIPNKVFECLAAGKPVLTRDSDAVREVLADGENIFLCDPGSGAAIASSVLKIRASLDRQRSVGAAAYEISKARFAPGAIGRSVREAVEGLQAA